MQILNLTKSYVFSVVVLFTFIIHSILEFWMMCFLGANRMLALSHYNGHFIQVFSCICCRSWSWYCEMCLSLCFCHICLSFWSA